MTGEHAVEGEVGKRQLQPVPDDELGVRDTRAGDLDHAGALVEAGHFAA